MSISTNLDGVTQLGSWTFTLGAALPAGANVIGGVTQAGAWTVTANAGANLNTSALNLESTQALVKAKTDNLDVLLSTRLKPADTLAGVTTVGAVTAITNALPAGSNTIGAVTINGTVPISGSLSANPLPALTQDDDKQYDDDGIPYVNPNVPGADIATGDKQSQQLTTLQQIAAGVPVTSLPAVVISSGNVSVGNFPANQSVTVTNATLAVTGSLATTPSSLPTFTQDDDKQYDDEGFPFVNTNVPGADIATGDRQTQGNAILAQIASGVPVTNLPAVQAVSGAIAVSNLPATQNVNVTNATLAVTGSLATTAPTTPTVTQDDDKQYDDDGIPYVNPNVPGADIATGDKQTQQLTALQAIQAGLPVTSLPPVTVSNFPAVQAVTVGNVVTVAGSLATTVPSLPTVVSRDDAQFDDDGFMFVNPNVPGADIATGDKQSQQLQVLQQIAAIVPASTLAVSNFPAQQQVVGSVQAYDNTLNDTLQAILLELRVVSNLISMQGQPNNLGPDVLRNDLQLYQ